MSYPNIGTTLRLPILYKIRTTSYSIERSPFYQLTIAEENVECGVTQRIGELGHVEDECQEGQRISLLDVEAIEAEDLDAEDAVAAHDDHVTEIDRNAEQQHVRASTAIPIQNVYQEVRHRLVLEVQVHFSDEHQDRQGCQHGELANTPGIVQVLEPFELEAGKHAEDELSVLELRELVLDETVAIANAVLDAFVVVNVDEILLCQMVAHLEVPYRCFELAVERHQRLVVDQWLREVFRLQIVRVGL